MFMEPNQNEFYNHINGFTPYDDDILPIFDQNSLLTNGYRFKDEHPDLSFLDSPHSALYPNTNPNPGSVSVSPDLPPQADSPDDFNDCVFNYIDQILVEENVEGIQSLFCDPLELQATERSLYEALGQEYPSPSKPPPILGLAKAQTQAQILKTRKTISLVVLVIQTAAQVIAITLTLIGPVVILLIRFHQSRKPVLLTPARCGRMTRPLV
ncbi:hypothetical protein HanRHA438_Chr08g0372481 [Helianthus annuus]|nr:hypothetical protein HanRHA438_Chr08g0372481 [Helianthus annuus]